MNPRELLRNLNKRRYQKDVNARIMVYDKIRKLTENSMSISASINVLLKRYNKKPSGVMSKLAKSIFGDDATLSPTEEYLRHVKRVEERGGSLSEASNGGWVTKDEELILYAGETSGDIGSALKRSIDLMTKLKQMEKDIKKEMNPIKILLVALTAVIFGVSNFLIPILVEFGDPNDWNLISYSYYVFGTFFTENIVYIIIAFILLGFAYSKAKPNLLGVGREILTSIPIFNIPIKIYNSIQSGLVISSIGGLMASGVSLRESLESVKNNSDKYTSQGLEEIIKNIDAGMASGKALNSPFIGPLGEDIEDYSEASQIDEVLQRMGDQAIEDTVENIIKYTGMAKTLMIFLIAIFMVWLLSSFMMVIMDMDLSGGL